VLGGDEQVLLDGEVIEQLHGLKRPPQAEPGAPVGPQAGDVSTVERHGA